MNKYLELLANLPPGEREGGCILLHKKIDEYFKSLFEDAGYEFVRAFDDTWDVYKMPTGFYLAEYNSEITFICDQKKRIRGMIIVSEIGNIVEQTGIIKFRYEIYTENKEKPLKSKLSTRDQTGEPTAIRQNSQKETEDNCMYVQEAFLRDNLSGKLVSICRCEGSDAKWRDHCICAMCAGGCVLDKKYPGWSDPANWDENPASVLF